MLRPLWWQGRLAQSVTAASMERRPGPEYAFCDPLLSDALPRIGDGEVMLSSIKFGALLLRCAARHQQPLTASES